MKKYSFIFRERGMAALFVDMMLRDYGIHDFVFVGDKESFEGYASEEEIRRAGEIGFEICSDRERVGELEKRFEDNRAVYLDILNHAHRIKHMELDDEGLRDVFEKLCRITKDNVDIYFLTEPHFLEKVEREIRRKIAAICPEPDMANECIICLTTPMTAHDFLNRERVEWAHLVKRNAGVMDREKEILDHYEKFVFLFLDKKAKHLSKKFDRMSRWSEEKLDEIECDILRIDNDAEEKRKRVMDKFAIDRKTLTLCEAVRRTAILRFNMRFFMNSDFLFDRTLKEIARRKHLAMNQVSHCLLSEIHAVLRGEEIDLTEVGRRNSKFVAVKKGDNWTFHTGKKSASIAEKVRPVVDKGTIYICGNIANTGKVTGRVRVLKNIETEEDLDVKIRCMKRGEILVTEMTRPQLIGACKMASAIITDEGGINCHASIISRELDIPCVIGTKIATQVLEDRDTVDVDANRGMVRIVSREVERKK